MKMHLAIQSSAAISPQETFDSDLWTREIRSYPDNQLRNIEPDYKAYIHPVAVRRMGRVVKAGIACGMKALQKAGIGRPDGIIGGSGRGSMTNTQSFLNDMIALQEEALNPTHFIQSTYNSVTGWLALNSKSNGYNQMFVHRGHSFEWALMDAQLFMSEYKERRSVLAGSFDEMTQEFFHTRGHLGNWKKERIDNASLFYHQESEGSICGEGSAFFCLSNEQLKGQTLVRNMQMGQEVSIKAVKELWKAMCAESHISASDIDLVLTGRNGSATAKAFYDAAFLELALSAEVCFKHLCGEYDTATSFGLFIANEILRTQQIPPILYQSNPTKNKYFNNLLIINHYGEEYLSLILVSVGDL